MEEPFNISLPHAIDLNWARFRYGRRWYLSCDESSTGEVDGALQLAVFDLAYAEYLDSLTDVESILLADASIGLSGAIGAFTGAAITGQPLRLNRR